MSDKLEGAVISILEKAATGIDSATGFVLSEAPEVVTQLLMWQSVRALILGSISGIVLSFGVKFFIAGWSLAKTKADRHNDDCRERRESLGHYIYTKDRSDYAELFIAPIVVVVVSIPAVISYLMVSVKIAIAPKLYILEYAADLAK